MRQRTIRFVLARVAAVGMLGIASLVFASPANADVIANEHFTFTVTNMNPCAPEDGLVTLNFEEHRVTQQLADGTLVIHSHFHGTGSSTSGVQYVAHRHHVPFV